MLASFYALGASRHGYLVHRATRGDSASDRASLEAAGLDVGALEAQHQLAIVEFDPDEPAETSPQAWQDVLERSLAGGYSALWYSRFAVGPGDVEYRNVIPLERAWGQHFAGSPVVTLCPYIVGALDGTEALRRLTDVAGLHAGVLVASDDGLALMRPATS